MSAAAARGVCGRPRAASPALLAAAAALLASLAASIPAAAQQPEAKRRVDNLLANAAIGAVAGGTRALIRRDPVHSGLLRGAAGGAVLSASKQIAGVGFSGSGGIGRVINSAGIAAINRSPGDTLAFLLPFGPFVVELVPRAEDRVRPRLNLWTTALTVASALEADAHLDVRATLSTGAIVFTRTGSRMPGRAEDAGFVHPGVIYLNRDVMGTHLDRRELIAHEAIHVLQWDAYHAVVTRGAERAALRRAPGGAWLGRHVELGALAPLTVWALSSRISDHLDTPWEREAYLLTGDPWPRRR